jgi:putative transposase
LGNRKSNATGSKKNLNSFSHEKKRSLLDPHHPEISLARQAELLGMSRSSIYYRPRVNAGDIMIMNLIDEIFTKYPFYGKRRMCVELNRRGMEIGIKKTRSLMRIMGLEAIYAKPRTSIAHPEHRKFPYLLRGLAIGKPNMVWATDITYIRMPNGWIYLTAIIDWFSRFIIAWEVSITLEADFCIAALQNGLEKYSQPEIFNSDQGVQFTSQEFIAILQGNNIRISMDGRGRCFDNIFTERLWRSIKYEEVYLKEYNSVQDAVSNLGSYIDFYNNERPHQSLKYQTPAEVYFQ